MADENADLRFQNTTLVLAGHGSTRNPDSAIPTYDLADTLAARGLFAEIKAGFVKQEPKLAGVLATCTTETVVIVPNMACRGYITATVIPRDAGLSGSVTERQNPKTGRAQRIHLTDPIGTDPRVGEAIAANIHAMMKQAGLGMGETALLLIGHGSEKSRESFNETRALADRLPALGLNCERALAFLEEAPEIPGWSARVDAANVIVQPVLIAAGLHGAEDIPAQLGLDPDGMKTNPETGAAGPYDVDGRKVWYLRAIGEDPVLADIVLDRVSEILA